MSSASQTIPILLSLVAAICGAFAQYFYKAGALQIAEVPIYKNWQLFAGLLTFTLVTILFIFAFRMGGKLFVVYPAYATTYIWVGLIGVLWDHESWSWTQVTGVLMIVLGVCVLASGQGKPQKIAKSSPAQSVTQ